MGGLLWDGSIYDQSPKVEAAAERLHDIEQELYAARVEFQADANDFHAEWVRQAHVRYDDAIAVAQEWMVPNCPEGVQ